MTTALVNNDAPLQAYQQFIQDICRERGWDKRTPEEKMLFLTEEVGELAKEVRKHAGKYGYAKPDSSKELGHELVDIFNFVLDLANAYDVDLATAFAEKWEYNHTRTWQS